MKVAFTNRTDRTNTIVAIAIGLIAFVVYYLTKAATVCFWDCGEFNACGYVLGIPHPPGTPLYILLARFFSMLPISTDLVVRMNLLSGVASSFTVAFGYLASERLLARWFGSDESTLSLFLIRGGAACGAFLAAFSLTNWTNSVESEVYGLAMMMFVAMLWMALLYLDSRRIAVRQRLMLLLVFTAFLGIGIHMTTLLALPVLGLFFALRRQASQTTWILLTLFFVFELYAVFALSSLPGEIPYYLPVAFGLIAFLFYVFSFEQIPRLYLWTAAGLLLACAPLPALAVSSLRKVDITASALYGPLQLLGGVASGAVLLLGLWALLQYFSKKAPDDKRREFFTVAIFVGATAVAVGLLFLPKGYFSFLLLSALATIALVAVCYRDIDWPVTVALVGSSLIVLGIREFAWGLGVAAVAIVVLGVAAKIRGWRTALLILLMAIIGFSIHLFIPIRSAQEPAINENNPSESLDATINFLERKQYGSMSMIERMFIRRADWGHQFGDYNRLGFWRFFKQQYGTSGFAFVVFFLLGVFGLWELIRRRYIAGLPFLLLLLVSTVGLILYMNFADGTRDAPGLASGHIEVRNRDYFFTPGFILFGLAIGTGLAIGLQYLRQALSGQAPALRKGAVGVASSLLLVLPLVSLTGNYNECDRSRNYMPYDYAWNLLQSADPNAVLFTNGDNDTFPLWCLQEVYGVRTDVKVINLALANTKWYLKQIQTTMGVDLGWTEQQIDSLQAFRLPSQATVESRNQKVSSRILGYLGTSQSERDSLFNMGPVPFGMTFQYRDMLVDKLIYLYLGKMPINFSVTSSRASRNYLGRPINHLLSLNGMDWRLNTEGRELRVDVDETTEFFNEGGRFQARGVNDPTVHKSETARRLTANWTNGFLMVADSLRVAGRLEEAEAITRRAWELIPHADDAVDFLAAVFADQGKAEEIRDLIGSAIVGDSLGLETQYAMALRTRGEIDAAESAYQGVLNAQPTYRAAFEGQLQMFYETEQMGKMRALLERWLNHNPNDRRVARMLNELKTDSQP